MSNIINTGNLPGFDTSLTFSETATSVFSIPETGFNDTGVYQCSASFMADGTITSSAKSVNVQGKRRVLLLRTLITR